MTRRIVLRSMGWYGDADEPADFTALPPTGYEQYRIGGTLRVVSSERPPVVETIIVTDKGTGTRVTLAGEAGSVDGLRGDSAPEYVTRLWADARHLAGLVRRGRPSTRHVRIEAIVEAAAALPVGADTRDTVAAALGLVRIEDGDPTTEPTSAFRDDVSAAGGWDEIRRQAAERRARP